METFQGCELRRTNYGWQVRDANDAYFLSPRTKRWASIDDMDDQYDLFPNADAARGAILKADPPPDE